MIPAELRSRIPALDPARRPCRGRGKPEWLVTFGLLRRGKFQALPEMDSAGGAIRLCAACALACEAQARAVGWSTRVTNSAGLLLTAARAMI